MEILVLSDSHGHRMNIMRLLHALPNIKYLLFCGDGLGDLYDIETAFPHVTVLSVKGNCDLFRSGDEPSERLFELDGVRILMMHGHLQSVKHGIESAVSYAAEKGADLLLYGHTHVANEEYFTVGERRICAFNPGSVGVRIDGCYHYGILTIKNKCFLPSHGTF